MSREPDEDGVVRRPLTLSDRQRRVMESRGRTHVQPRPPDAKPMIFDRRLPSGLTPDVVFTLEALRHLAEQGNQFARFMYEEEMRTLGITPPSIILPGR